LGRGRAGSRAQSGLRRQRSAVHGRRRGVQLRAGKQAEDDDPDGMHSTYIHGRRAEPFANVHYYCTYLTELPRTLTRSSICRRWRRGRRRAPATRTGASSAGLRRRRLLPPACSGARLTTTSTSNTAATPAAAAAAAGTRRHAAHATPDGTPLVLPSLMDRSTHSKRFDP